MAALVRIAATLGNATTGMVLKKCLRFHGEVGKNVPLGQQAEREEKARATPRKRVSSRVARRDAHAGRAGPLLANPTA